MTHRANRNLIAAIRQVAEQAPASEREAALQYVALLFPERDRVSRCLSDVLLDTSLAAAARAWGLVHLRSLAPSDWSEVLLLGIRDREPEVRRAAVYSLGQIGDRSVVPTIHAVLEHDLQESVREAAARALHDFPSRRTRDVLVRSLRHDVSPQVRFAAAYELGKFSSYKSVPPVLVSVLLNSNEDPSVRGVAAEQLAMFESADALTALLQSLDDPAPEVRFWCAYSIGEIGDARHIPRLREIAETDLAEVPGWRSVSEEAKRAIHEIIQRGMEIHSSEAKPADEF